MKRKGPKGVYRITHTQIQAASQPHRDKVQQKDDGDKNPTNTEIGVHRNQILRISLF